jgi:hypothetical protein
MAIIYLTYVVYNDYKASVQNDPKFIVKHLKQVDEHLNLDFHTNDFMS